MLLVTLASLYTSCGESGGISLSKKGEFYNTISNPSRLASMLDVMKSADNDKCDTNQGFTEIKIYYGREQSCINHCCA